jgi:hypothetical protein
VLTGFFFSCKGSGDADANLASRGAPIGDNGRGRFRLDNTCRGAVRLPVIPFSKLGLTLPIDVSSLTFFADCTLTPESSISGTSGRLGGKDCRNLELARRGVK